MLSLNYAGSQTHFLSGGSGRGPATNKYSPDYDLELRELLPFSAQANFNSIKAILPNYQLPYPTFTGPGATTSASLTAYPQFAGSNAGGLTDLWGETGNAAYNSFQMLLIQRPWHNLSGFMDYTRAKEIDDVGNHITAGNTMRLTEAQARGILELRLARLTGLAVDALDPQLPPQIVSTGTAFAIVPLRSHEALARLNVSPREATEWLREGGARWFYVLGPVEGKEPAWRARMQFNGGEDPATGSAAGCAISYLVGRGAVAPDERICLRQGVEIGRPSELHLSAHLQAVSALGQSATVTGVRVAGSTVLVAKGQLFLP